MHIGRNALATLTAVAILISATAQPAFAEAGVAPAPTDEQWDRFFLLEAEATAERAEFLRTRIPELRDQLRAAQRDRDQSREERERRVELLREAYNLAREQADQIEQGELFIAPNAFEASEVGTIGVLNFHHTYNDGTPRLIVSVDDQNAVYTLRYSTPNYNDRGIRIANTWHESAPFWVTNNHDQVRSAEGTSPTLTGLFMVAEPKRFNGEQYRCYMAIAPDLAAERQKWLDRQQEQ